MSLKYQKTLQALFAHPVSAKIKWRDIEALFRDKGAVASIRDWLEMHGVRP